MYVLQHADRPQLYAGLPEDPKVSPMVELWKGTAKPLGLAAIGLALIGAFFHYVTTTPIVVDRGGRGAGAAAQEGDTGMSEPKHETIPLKEPISSSGTRWPRGFITGSRR